MTSLRIFQTQTFLHLIIAGDLQRGTAALHSDDHPRTETGKRAADPAAAGQCKNFYCGCTIFAVGSEG